MICADARTANDIEYELLSTLCGVRRGLLYWRRTLSSQRKDPFELVDELKDEDYNMSLIGIDSVELRPLLFKPL